MQNFIICSHGWSATNWFAYVLNLHPQITCTHGAANLLPEKKELYKGKELKNQIFKFHKGYVSRLDLSIDDHYKKIKESNNSDYYGSVHLLRIRDIPLNIEKNGSPKESYKILNLVRNPVNLVWSGYGQLMELFTYDLNELHWTLGKLLHEAKDFVFELSRKYNLYIGNYDVLAFLCSCCILGSLRKDIDAEKEILNLSNIEFLGQIKMEELTSSIDYYKNIFYSITDSDIKLSATYTNTIFETKNINKHKVDTIKKSAVDRYDSFTDWQKEVFLYFFTKNDLYDAYNEMGYELTFLK